MKSVTWIDNREIESWSMFKFSWSQTPMSESLVPESVLPYPPLYEDKRFVVLSDWDGTITTFDSNDYMTDNLGYGKKQRRQVTLDILAGLDNFRDGFKKMVASIVANGHTFDECKEILRRDTRLDPGFREFYDWCKKHDIPFIIVSSGMAPMIRAVLSNSIGEEAASEVQIIANDVTVSPDEKWEILFRHPSSGFGHDKSQAILPYRNLDKPPILFFFGDGVSDISAARHADVLFVKSKTDGENDLAAYCREENITHIMFDTFSTALPIVQEIVSGNKSIQDFAEKGRATNSG